MLQVPLIIPKSNTTLLKKCPIFCPALLNMLLYVSIIYRITVTAILLKIKIAGDLIESKLNFAKKVTQLELNDREMSLFIAVIILSPGMNKFSYIINNCKCVNFTKWDIAYCCCNSLGK